MMLRSNYFFTSLTLSYEQAVKLRSSSTEKRSYSGKAQEKNLARYESVPVCINAEIKIERVLNYRNYLFLSK